MNELVQSELKKIFNGRFSTSESTRANYARGEDTYEPILSQAVVFPETNEEVSKILKLCNDHKIPVVPFGTGTSLATGQTNAGVYTYYVTESQNGCESPAATVVLTIYLTPITGPISHW